MEFVRVERLLLLPGLDGTGDLFSDFVAALPASIIATPIAYPCDRFLPYTDLLDLVNAAAPKTEPFVLLAESFSTPLAVMYAANRPPNLRGLVLCAGFVTNPLPRLSRLAKAIAKPSFFELQPPDFVLDRFLLGAGTPHALRERLRQSVRDVNPVVLSARVQEVLNCDASKELARTTVPLLYLGPCKDRLISRAARDQIVRIRPDATVKSVDGPHLLVQRTPCETAALVADFMGQLGT